MSKSSRRKIIIIIHGAVICGIVGFFLSTNFLTDLRYFKEEDKASSYGVDCDEILSISHSEIYLAAVDIPEGSTIAEEMVVPAVIPTDLLVNFYLQDKHFIIQSQASMDIKRGMILTSDLVH